VLIDRGSAQALERADAVRETTNNRMELQAAIEALAAVRRRGSRVLVLSDSLYVIKSCTLWMPAWKRRGWARKDGPLQNLEQLQELDRLMSLHDVTFRWVRGHAGDPGNEHVDELANHAMERLLALSVTRHERRFTWHARLP